MTKRRNLPLALVLSGLAFGAYACDDSNAEEAGEEIDQAVDDAEDAVEDAADDLGD